MATSTIQISQLTLATPVAADSVAGANAAGQARRYTVGSLGTAHTHAFATVPGLQTALDGKASVASTNLLRVETLNALNGAVTIEEGAGINVATQGSKITISSTGGGGGGIVSVNGQTATAVVLTNTSVSAASASHASQHMAGGSDLVLPVVASTSVTASANNYTLPTGDIIRLSSTATGTAVITGLSGGSAGYVRLLVNVSTNKIRLSHASGGSDSTNRFLISGGADLDLGEGESASAWYDATSQRWRVSGGASSAESTATGGIVSVNGYTATAVTLTSTDVSAASAVHTHTTAQVSGLDAQIVSQATNSQVVRSLNGITGVVSISHTSVSAAAASHTHGTGDVTGLDAHIADKATNAAVVRTPQGLTGTVTLTGVNLTVATAAGAITLTAPAQAVGGVVSVNGYTATAITLTSGDVTAASTSHSTTHRAGGSDEILPLVTAVSLTASVNNYSLPTGDVFRLSHTNTTTVNITGLATAVDGASRLLINVSTGASSSYTIKHADTNSTAVSRFIVPWAGDYVLSPNGGAALVIYDDTDDRWRVV